MASLATGTQTSTAIPGVHLQSGEPYSETVTPGYRPSDTPTFTPNPDCIPPKGYVFYQARPGDTWSSLAHKYKVSEQTILQASCFDNTGLSSIGPPAGSALYVPAAHPTESEDICEGAPYSWPLYKVAAGDTLYRLALITYVNVEDLQAANCLGKSTDIQAGRYLRLPFLPFSTPVVSPIFPPTVTPSATDLPGGIKPPPILPSWTPVTPAISTGTPLTPTTSATSNTAAAASPSATAGNPPALQPPSSTPSLPAATPTPVAPPTQTPVPPATDTPLPPASKTPVPPPQELPATETRASPPKQPEATGAISLNLCPWRRTLLAI